MNLSKYRFAFSITLSTLLIGSVMGAYFHYIAPHAKPLDLSTIRKILDKESSALESEVDVPVQEPVRTVKPERPPPAPRAVSGAPAQAPRAESSTAEFNNEKMKTTGPITELADKVASFRTVLPPSKLAPDMFVFSTLPYDAPSAEFPLVLVWQKDLEFPKTRVGDKGGGGSPPPGNTYGHPNPPPHPPPNPPPGPPPGPPEPPPHPPPEVSHSGL